MNQLNQGQLVKMGLPLPPLNEMLVAVEKIRELMESAERLEDAGKRTAGMVEKLDRAMLVSAFGTDGLA